jgi:hypothetical protein
LGWPDKEMTFKTPLRSAFIFYVVLLHAVLAVLLVKTNFLLLASKTLVIWN